MKINVTLPFDRAESVNEFCTMDAVRDIGTAVEKAGFHAGLVTDHPCPTGRWLDTGGHHAQSPFVMLALLAAATSTLRLQTGILVLPYRNPFLVARDVATLDRFSGGRVTLSVGAGYLKGEYRALGVDFDRRNETMDEYIRALRVSLTGDEFTFEGTGYTAFGNRILPGPVQKTIPIYIGGNAKRALRRVAELGDGWNPFLTGSGTSTATTRSAAMEGEEDVVAGIAYMKDHCDQIGRADMPDVVLGNIFTRQEPWTVQQMVDRISRYRELGVSAVSIGVEGQTRAEWCDDAARIGAEVIAQFRD